MGRGCRNKPQKVLPWVGWLPLAGFPPIALALRSRVPAWVLMGTLAFAIYFGFKWLTWWQARGAGARARTGRSLGYLLAWPGMDAHAFLNTKARPPAPTAGAWWAAILKTLFGVVVLWGLARQIPPHQILLAGWIGLFGLSFLSFFGAFHLLALLWQRAGVEARPIMHGPALARSPADFWGARCNLAFRQLSYDLVFRPLRRQLGIGGATMVTFLASGLIHELVISFPARAGYGLPTLYFILQGIGVLIERSSLGKHWGLRRGLSGRFFTLFLTAAPVYWLFHPPFVTRIVVPFMHAVGAL